MISLFRSKLVVRTFPCLYCAAFTIGGYNIYKNNKINILYDNVWNKEYLEFKGFNNRKR